MKILQQYYFKLFLLILFFFSLLVCFFFSIYRQGSNCVAIPEDVLLVFQESFYRYVKNYILPMDMLLS